MKCPKCERRMFKNNNVWECSNCGFNFITVDDNNIFTNLKNSDIPNKIKDYRENTEIGKVIDEIGEKITVQVKKEEAYIKTRKDNYSTAAFDENEFFISKYVFDGAEFVKNKKEELDNSKNVKHQHKKQKVDIDGEE